MKISYVLIAAGLLLQACKNDSSDSGVREIRSGDGPNANLIRNPATADMPLDTSKLAKIEYEEKEFNFDTIKSGDIVEHRFKFKNTGNVPLSILNARSSCGCTVSEWPQDPIPPGGTGDIYARFNTEGLAQKQAKLIVVTANTYPNETKVKLVGFVKK